MFEQDKASYLFINVLLFPFLACANDWSLVLVSDPVDQFKSWHSARSLPATTVQHRSPHATQQHGRQQRTPPIGPGHLLQGETSGHLYFGHKVAYAQPC